MLRPFDQPETAAIVAFLRGIGIPVAAEPLPDSFLPGLTVRDGGLVVDPERLKWPGDLLHEAGHIAITEPERRPRLSAVSSDPGEEMAAIAWSWAAAAAIGLAPEIVFHADFVGGSGNLIDDFAAGYGVGVPMLVWFEMTVDRRAKEPGRATFPEMARWLR
ncbi:MAG TPA: hypothetical protein VH331_13565 [Allosphingosinicella sp.]|jgi:hypothetical protein|nr:hypothetical protein [Allosphingosinicella sp.]